MGFQIEKRGFFRVSDLANSLVADLVANGFTKVHPTGSGSEAKYALLEAGPTVDPLQATQPWRIKFMWGTDAAGTPISETTSDGKLDIIVATPNQLYNDFHATYTRGTAANAPTDVIGLLGSVVGRKPASGAATPSPDRTFIDHSRLKISGTTVDEPRAYPMNYRLSITDRGVAVVVWEQGSDNVGNRYSWFVVQRPVDNQSGNTIVAGRAPVHCVYGLMQDQINQPWVEGFGRYSIRRFVVREEDVFVPVPIDHSPTVTPTNMMGVDAVRNTMDYAAIINPFQQVSITENNKYVITFPNNLNTARYSYTHELDMIAYTSADVVSAGTEVPVQVYGESAPRRYMAMNANGPNNTGMRLLLLCAGGGI